MKFILRFIASAASVMLLAYFLPGIIIKDFATAMVVVIVLSLCNMIIKPILVFFTLPITVVTLGLFLLVINAVIIMLCAKLVNGFAVDGFLTALLFSLILSISQSIVFSLTGGDK